MRGTPTSRHSGDPVGDWDDEPDEGHGTFLEVVLTIGAALLLAFLVQQFLVKPFKIPSGSMENTLHCGDRVLVDRLSLPLRRSRARRRGRVQPARRRSARAASRTRPSSRTPPRCRSAARTTRATATKADTNYIKRLIGLPGRQGARSRTTTRSSTASGSTSRTCTRFRRPTRSTAANCGLGPDDRAQGHVPDARRPPRQLR